MEDRKVVFIGLGSIALKHIAALNQLQGVTEIFALRSRLDAKSIDGVHSFYQMDEISEIEPLFILICNPTVHHEETIKNILKFRIPIFIEKPALHRLENSQNLNKLIKQYRIKTYVACNLRFLGCLKYVKEYLEKNKTSINEVNVYAGSHLPSWRPGVDFRKNYSAIEAMGGGVHLDLIHELDYLYWFFGKPDKVQSLMRSVSTLNISAIDYANYILMYPLFTANVVLNYYRKEYKRSLEIVFDTDIWTVDLAKNTVHSSIKNKIIYSDKSNISSTYKLQMQKFIRNLDNDEPEFNSFAESIEVLKIALNDI